jgi:hypothetical protein
MRRIRTLFVLGIIAPQELVHDGQKLVRGDPYSDVTESKRADAGTEKTFYAGDILASSGLHHAPSAYDQTGIGTR